ncbi:MAG TPA: BON domain-containing protein [Steroidobacteraceae bacterium]|nr:BON domain-containing protein [Steroidobacteraceae bacterium]
MNNHKSLAVAAILATGVLASGCDVFRGQSTAGQYVDDVAITARVKARLADSSRVDALDVNVDSFNGKVTLTGWASSSAESKAASELARSVDGVRSVDNQLRIKN